MVESNWRLVYHGFNPSEEGIRESLCTLANGYIGLRGAAYESPASRIHYPGTYMAGGYNKLSTQIGGKKIYNEDLVNFPNCLPVTFKAENGEWFSPSRSKIIFYRQTLDMHKGVLKRRVRFQNKSGQRFTVETTRIVSMHDQHLISFKYIITPENYSGFITVKTMLDGAVTNSGVERYRQLSSKHLVPVSVGDFDSNGAYLLMKVSQSKITFAQASKIRIFSSGKEKKLRIKSISKGRETIARIFDLYVEKGKSYEIEKTVSVYTSKDKDVKDPLSLAVNALRGAPLFEVIYSQHIKIWDSLWKNFDIQIEADDFSQRVLRLHIFHLLQIASPHIVNIDAGLPARGLHGEAYRGHIFWDGVFAMAFYDLHMPGISKSILLYRYRRLNAARHAARQCGFKGAVYPWQSGATGEEETQAIHLNPLSGEWGPDYSCNQRHVSLAIAYNIWQHYVRTEDINFIIHYGAEMFLSIARFFASLAEFS
ncbi:MAG: glycoside hydrolase family 65 protein, partial [Candidatus Omnitrophica bacterium]|nr:glycoside hydrolase family 65 protein [Candidatus Omnitrophota bacterium]